MVGGPKVRWLGLTRGVVSLRGRDRSATGLSKRQAGRDRHARPNGALRDGGMDDGRGQAKGGEQRRRIGPDAVVVELRDPHLDGEQLTFDVRVGEGDLAGADGPP
jgi:hypothetical protein